MKWISALKIIITIVFITLPFVGFKLGMEYQKSLTGVNESPPVVYPPLTPTPLSDSNDTSDWTTYENKTLQLAFSYPSQWGIPIENQLSTSTNVEFLDGKEGTDAEGLLVTPRLIISRGVFYEQYFNRTLTFKEYIERFLPSAPVYNIELRNSYTLSNFSGEYVIYNQGRGSYTNILLGRSEDSDELLTIFYRYDVEKTDSSGMPETLNKILSTFRFLDENTVSITPSKTTCGNGVCEEYERCTPSHKFTTDCGSLFCVQDCETQ